MKITIHTWLMVIWFIAFLMTIPACNTLDVETRANLETRAQQAVRDYMEEQGTRDMFCFTTSIFDRNNNFIQYGEQCYIHCLGLPTDVAKVWVNGDNHTVKRYHHFCEPVDRLRNRYGN